MLFSGLTFLYCFLPAVLAAYFLAPKHWKNAVLLVFSLIFYAWGEPRYVFLMLFTILGFYLCGLGIGRSRTEGMKRLWLTASVLLGLGASRRVEGQPVCMVEDTEYWAIVNSFDQAGVYLLSYGNPDDYGYFGLYGKTWLAYRQKQEEGAV